MLRLIAQRVAQAAPRCTAASGWHMGRSFGEAATQASSATSKVISSLVVERLPWITPEPKDYEVAYQEWQATLVSKYKILPEEFTDVDKSTATEDGDQETEVASAA